MSNEVLLRMQMWLVLSCTAYVTGGRKDDEPMGDDGSTGRQI